MLFLYHDCARFCAKTLWRRIFRGGGGESRTFLGRDAPVRNDVPDGWRKQILKGSMEKQGLWLGSNKMWTAMNTQQTIQIFFITVKVLLESRWSSSRLRGRGGRTMCGKGCAPPIPLPKIQPCCLLSGY